MAASALLTCFTVAIVSRQEWRAGEPNQIETSKGFFNNVVIHDTGMQGYSSLEDLTVQLANIEKHHMKDRGLDDLPFNFFVGEDGAFFEGRGWRVARAQTESYKDDSLEIAFIGEFENVEPSQDAIESVKKLLQEAVHCGYLDAKFDLKGHRDLEKRDCPGKKLYAALSQLKDTS